MKERDFEDNGIFLIPIKYFCQLFVDLDVCRVHENYHYSNIISTSPEINKGFSYLYVDMLVKKKSKVFVAVN